MAERPRVVLTGVGTVSALAVGGRDALRDALRGGRSGLRTVRGFAIEEGESRLGGEVGDLDGHLTPDEVRRLPRVSQFALVACRLALADAGLDRAAPPGLGLVLGSHFGDFRSSESFARGFLTRGPLGLSPLMFPNTVMNGIGAQAAIALGVRGPLVTLNQAAIAGDLAIARAVTMIRGARAPAMLAGGADELSPILYRELARLGVVSPGRWRVGPGTGEGCWPFDRRANGTVMGEGATFVLLEEMRAAVARGAEILAEVTGAAWGNLPAPAHGLPRQSGRTPGAVRRAMDDAGCEARDIAGAYLTGSGEPDVDRCEADLVRRALGPGRGPRLTSLTPLAGSHGGLGGLRVAAAAVMSIGERRLPGLPDLREPIREDLLLVAGSPEALEGGSVLVHGLARGGGHAALILDQVA